MKVDQRSNFLFAAGGLNGDANVYDAGSGEPLASYQFVAPFDGFINDVVVTKDAAYFTNSFAPYLYRVSVGPGGQVENATYKPIKLTGDWNQVPGPFVFNANGIEATSDGKWLIVVNSALGKIYRIDPQTGEAKLIDVDGPLTNGDGILLQGQTLYVVRNQLNQIAVVELAPDLSSGTVSRTITNPAFDVPTTIAPFGSSLYAVNARFGTPDPDNAEYQVVKVPRN
jgi:sugar lactone lactonase YvrE